MTYTSLLFFLSEQVYGQKNIHTDITRLIRTPLIVTKKAISKNNKWTNFILQPKLNGIRALLIARDSRVFLCYEAHLETIAQDMSLESFVMEVEVYENTVYVCDMLFNGQTLIEMTMLQRLYLIPPVL